MKKNKTKKFLIFLVFDTNQAIQTAYNAYFTYLHISDSVRIGLSKHTHTHTHTHTYTKTADSVRIGLSIHTHTHTYTKTADCPVNM